MKAALLIVSLVGMFVVSTPTFAADCPRHSTPGSYQNPKPWGGTDTGVVIDGFADLSHPSGGTYVVEHGVDVSSHNIVLYDVVAECGGTFAFLRVDKKLTEHTDGFEAVGIKVIPYYFFPIPKALRERNLYGNENETGFLGRFAEIGTEAAISFDRKYGFANLTTTAIAKFDGALLSLDIEEKLLEEARSTAVQRAHFGRYYARAVCSFVAYAKSKQANIALMLYTTPSVYADYLDKALAEDNACLQQMPVWLARTTSDGGDLIRSSSSTANKQAQRTCLLTGGNRCIAHQYSHRGIFAAAGVGAGGHPAHIDLDRFFESKWVENESGGQFVRSEHGVN